MKLDVMLVIQRVLEAGCQMLPNRSNMMSVGRCRYIQSVYEVPEYRNPDTFIRDLLPPVLRWLFLLKAKMRLSKLRLNPFYYYILARTKYYDQVFTDAISRNIKYIINIGCGSDTRAYRFSQVLNQQQIKVLECDQPHSIFTKRQLAKRMWCTDHVAYVPIDLNADSWPELEYQLAQIPSAALVVLEGVSPYIDEESFTRFLNFIAVKLRVGSCIAYDYKIRSVDDDFGRGDRTKRPFRLPATKKDIIAYHEALGYKLEYMELSSELSLRLLPNLVRSGTRLFAEDCLLRLTVAKK